MSRNILHRGSLALLLPLLLLLASQNSHSQIADIDVLHYGIHIDTINKSPGNEYIRAHTEVTFHPSFAMLNQFTLDLLPCRCK